MQTSNTTTRAAAAAAAAGDRDYCDCGIPAMAAALCPMGAFLLVCAVVSTVSIGVNEKDASEFASFAGWYAFLVGCCVLPTACAMYRHRRNGIEVRENLASIQRRMGEIERRGWGEEMSFARSGVVGGGGLVVGRGGDGGDGGGGGGTPRNLNAPENRDREWEFLEGLFAGSGGGDGGGGGGGDGENSSRTSTLLRVGDRGFESYVDLRRWMATNDIGTTMGEIGVTTAFRILAYVEREHGRRRARGRRLVAALKRCSLKVEECHLIIAAVGEEGGRSSRSSNDDDVDVSGWLEGGVEEGGGDIESRGDHGNDDDCDGDVKLTRTEFLERVEQGGEGSSRRPDDADGNVDDDAVGATSTSTESAVVVAAAGADDDGAVVESRRLLDGTNTRASSLLSNDDGDERRTTTTSPRSARSEATPASAASAGSTPTSDRRPTDTPPLHRACDIPAAAADADEDVGEEEEEEEEEDEEEEDGRYSALCVPVTAAGPRDDDGGGGTAAASTRAVPPNCAICLLPYVPGNYVTWSSNEACRHVYHRDCILTWLLRKDDGRAVVGGGSDNVEEDGRGRRYLCPCCRGEFVSSSLLSELDDADNVNDDAGGRGGNRS
jgi:hypothetical protein